LISALHPLFTAFEWIASSIKRIKFPGPHPDESHISEIRSFAPSAIQKHRICSNFAMIAKRFFCDCLFLQFFTEFSEIQWEAPNLNSKSEQIRQPPDDLHIHIPDDLLVTSPAIIWRRARGLCSSSRHLSINPPDDAGLGVRLRMNTSKSIDAEIPMTNFKWGENRPTRCLSVKLPEFFRKNQEFRKHNLFRNI
jgi:hypothetical protein